MSILLIILTSWMVSSFSREIISLNHRLTSKIQSGIDLRLNEIDRFAIQLQQDDANLYLSRTNSITNADTALLTRLFSRLDSYKLSNSFISHIFIYYPKLDYVVGDLGYFESREYFLLSNELRSKGYSDWLKNLTKARDGGYYFIPDRGQNMELYLIKHLPYHNSDTKNAVLMIQINKDEIKSMLQSEDISKTDSLNLMLTDEHTVYASNENSKNLHLLDQLPKARTDNPYVITESYFASVQASDFYPFSYVTLSDKQQILHVSYFIQNIAYGALALCMAAGCILFALLSIRSNKPIRKILDEQKNSMESLFLFNLLENEERNPASILSAMQRFGLQLKSPLFQVMVLRSSSGFVPSQMDTTICKVSDSLRAKWQGLGIIGAEFHGELVFLLHMEAGFDDARMELVADDLFHASGYDTENLFLFAGNICARPSDIVTSYQQAHMLTECSEHSPSHILFYRTQVLPPLSDKRKTDGAIAEYEIAMLEKDYIKARTYIDFLFNQYIGTERNAFAARAKKYAVVNSLIEALSQIPETGKSGKDYVALLSDARDNQSLLAAAHEIFRFLVEHQQLKQTVRKENVALQAQEYIHANFSDPMIGLYSISDTLGISNTYLSTVFKKNYGTGVAQYINLLRIEKAKKLILNTELSVKEIASLVGFSSDVTFIRVFKQFENTTPGKFKKEK